MTKFTFILRLQYNTFFKIHFSESVFCSTTVLYLQFHPWEVWMVMSDELVRYVS
jgi:hypothetical protein